VGGIVGAALATYLLLAAGVGAAVQASGVNPSGVKSNLPEWKFVCALAGEGQLSADSGAIGAYALTPNPQARQIAREILARDIRQLPQNWRYILVHQLGHLWVDNDTAIYAFYPALEGTSLYGMPNAKTATAAYLMGGVDRGIFLPIVLLAAWGVCLIHRQRRWGEIAAFLGCLIAVYFLTHLVIETLPRYRYLVSPAIFMLGAPAWAWLTRLTSKERQLEPRGRR
jgi:hypothetical protein